ncbi:membrane-associated transporter protein-like [Glandiceps talaboti]
MASPNESPVPSSSHYGQSGSQSIPQRRRSSMSSPHRYSTSYGSYSSSITMSMKSPYFRPRSLSISHHENDEASFEVQRAYRRHSRRRQNSHRTSISQIPQLPTVEALADDTVVAQDYLDVPEPPRRSTIRLILLSAMVFGTQYCFATETALSTPILLKIGLPNQLYSLNWFLGPILGFVFQPLIGTFSDRCTSSWGRRRPFILALCIGILIGLTLVLNGAYFGKLVEHSDTYTVWSIVFTIIGVVVMDFCADSVDCPHRAYIVDVCSANDIERGMNIRALLTGLGGGIGYVIGGIDWMKTPLGPALGSQVRVIYVFNLAVCLVAFTLTLFSVKETPLKKVRTLDNIQEDRQALLSNEADDDDVTGIKYGGEKKNYGSINYYEEDDISSYQHNGGMYDRNRNATEDRTFETCADASLITAPGQATDSSPEPFSETSTLTLLKSIVKMPRELVFLCVNHFLGELAYLSVLLFFTDYMAQVVYKGDPSKPEDSPEHQRYDDGVKMGCWGMCIFAFSAALYSLILDRLILKLSLRTLYVGGELIFAVGTGLQAIFSDSVIATLVLCSTYGVIYTTIATLPFIILARFHDNEDYVNRGAIQRGLATDTACLQCQLFLAQILLSAILGPIASAAGTHLTTVLIASAAGFGAAFFSALFVIYTPQSQSQELD